MSSSFPTTIVRVEKEVLWFDYPMYYV